LRPDQPVAVGKQNANRADQDAASRKGEPWADRQHPRRRSDDEDETQDDKRERGLSRPVHPPAHLIAVVKNIHRLDGKTLSLKPD